MRKRGPIQKNEPARDEGEIDAVFIDKDGEEEEFELEYEIFENHLLVWLVG